MTNTTTYTSSPLIANVGAVTTSKCNIIDNSGALTIYNFRIIGQEYINWNVGYGTRSNKNIAVNISGSYLNIYGSTVSTIIYFEGTISAGGALVGVGHKQLAYMAILTMLQELPFLLKVKSVF